MLVTSGVGLHASVACKMRVAETCGAEPLVCVAGGHAADNAGSERWFAGFLLSTIGPFDCQDELRGPAVGVHLSCHDLAVENNLVWHAFHEQLEVHHPGQCCVGCKRSWLICVSSSPRLAWYVSSFRFFWYWMKCTRCARDWVEVSDQGLFHWLVFCGKVWIIFRDEVLRA